MSVWDAQKIYSLDWDHLKTFHIVASEGSISAAGTLLDITQPAMSRRVTTLEKRLGISLFDRAKSGLTLTPEGEILHSYVKEMVIEANIAEHIHPPSAKKLPSLVVSTTPAIAKGWLMKFLPDFLEKNPKINLQLVCMREPQDCLIADVYIKPYIPMQPTLCQHYLMSFTMGLYASKKYLETFGTPRNAQDLDNHRLISFSNGPKNPLESTNWLLKVGHRSSSLRLPYLEFTSADLILKAAKEGLGIVELGKGFPEIMGVNLEEVLPELEGPKAEICYIYPEYKKEQPEIKALLDHLVATSFTAVANEIKQDYTKIKLSNVG